MIAPPTPLAFFTLVVSCDGLKYRSPKQKYRNDRYDKDCSSDACLPSESAIAECCFDEVQRDIVAVGESAGQGKVIRGKLKLQLQRIHSQSKTSASALRSCISVMTTTSPSALAASLRKCSLISSNLSDSSSLKVVTRSQSV